MGEQCDHGQLAKGKGCVKDSNWEKNGLMRVLLDRESPLYQAVYTRAHPLRTHQQSSSDARDRTAQSAQLGPGREPQYLDLPGY